MKVLALEREVDGVIASDYQPALLTAESRRVWELQQMGLVREIYFRQSEPCAVLVLECADGHEARRILATLPLVKAGLIDFEIIPLVPYPGHSRLFSGK